MRLKALIGGNLALAAAYWGLSHVNHAFFSGFHAMPMPLWPAAGLAVAAFLIGGARWAPGVALGTFLANTISLGASWPVAAGIVVMNTLAPFLGAVSIRRLVGGHVCLFERAREVAIFLAVAVCLVPVATAAGGVLSILAGGRISWGAASFAWSHWWLADAGGTLLFAPAILCWWKERPLPRGREGREYLGTSVATLLLAALAFAQENGSASMEGLHFLLIVPLVWISVRFPPKEILTLFPLVVAVALVATVAGYGPFAHAGSLQTLAFMAGSFGVAIFLATAIASERRGFAQAQAEATQALNESRERLRLALEGGGLGLWDRDMRTEKVVFNDHWAAMLGYRLEDIPPRVEGWSRLVHPEDLPGVMAVLHAHLAGELPYYEAQHRMRHRDGHWVWVLSRGRVTERDAAGKPLRIAGTHLDVSAEKAATEALRDREELYRTVIEQARDGICLVDADTAAFVDFNDATCGNLGYPREVFADFRIPDIEANESEEEVARHIVRLLREGGSVFESRHRAADGNLRNVRVSARLVTFKGRRLFSCIFTDITESKSYEKVLEREASRRKALFDNSRDGIVVLDTSGRVVETNAAFARMLGRTVRETASLRVSDWDAAFSPDSLRELSLAENPEGHVFETRHRRKDGSIYDVEISSNTVDLDGRRYHFCVCRDISLRKQREAEARRLLDILDTARDIVFSADAEGRIIYFNKSARELLGITDGEDLASLCIADIHPPEVAQFIQSGALPRTKAEGYWEGETVLRGRAGVDIPVWQVMVCHRDGRGKITHYSTIARNIAERKIAENQIRLLATVFEHSGEAILITDRDNRIIAVNQAFSRLTGYSAEEVLGQDPKLLSAGRTPIEVYRSMWQALSGEGYWQGEIWDRRKDGGVYPKWLSISTVRDGREGVTHYIASFTDISEHKAAEDRIRHLAHHDVLTGLPNRLHLMSRLEQALAAARRDASQVAVMFIDLDRFKYINDTLGHHVGDGLLVEVAQRLQGCVRESDVVARLGGDEFVVVLTGMDMYKAAMTVAEKILRSLVLPYDVEGHELRSSGSIGIGVFPGDGDSVETLMQNADTAMYHAKSLGRNNYQFFTPAMNRAASERLELENSLRQGLEANQFVLYYQPQISAGDGLVCGAEALVRWQHPELGLVPPAKFIPVAEETGLIIELGDWVLREALRQARAWRDAGVLRGRIGVNLSAHQLRNADLPEQVASALAEYGLDAGALELEITESVAMHNPKATAKVLGRLRDMGVALSMDDFGTGYSSLGYLKLLPIERLKLDRSFVENLETDANDATICSATIALAHALGLEVVAEGVETEAQREFLHRLGCDVFQGYFFSKPLPADEAGAFLAEAGRRM